MGERKSKGHFVRGHFRKDIPDCYPIDDFTGVKLVHLMYQLNSQHFPEKMFYFSLKMIYTVKFIRFLNSLIVTAPILVCHISCANIKKKRRFLSKSFDFFQ